MLVLKRGIYFIIIFCCFIAIKSFGQSLKNINDSTYTALINSANADLTKYNRADSIQQKYSEQFYNYYLDNLNSELGSKALSRAFAMWGNIGATEMYENAIKSLNYDSENWRWAFIYGHNVYYMDEERSIDDFVKLLENLIDKVTHPDSKSEALLYLAMHYNAKGNVDKTIEMAREIIEINANDFYVEQALGFQYEAEEFGVGSIAPDFTAQTVRGEKITLSDLEEKVVILEFWATWCGPCMPEIPNLKEIYSEYSKNDVQIIGVTLDSNAEKVKEFLREKEMDWPQILQPNEWDDEITKLYNVYVIPRNFIIGTDGTILAKDKRGEDLKNEIAKLLKQ